MVTGIVIPADEDQPIFQREFRGLSEYQEVVGGYIEAVDLGSLGASFFAHDESKLVGAPMNRRATLAWWLACPYMRHRDTIGGDVVLIGLPDAEGDTKSVPDELIALLFNTKSYKAEYQTADNDDAFNSNSMVYDDYWEAANAALVKFDRWAAVIRARVVPA
ncbi:DUF3846 domain-containing protein [Cryobacterium sp. 10S3]|uniref:DUF3846 domain-containing protein n=1 Tax=Cryobacterium sp. 10S3 TaxID=3048582 RepID=UPI002AC8CECB|nr:DUF3846 domain-containing protein [Cryobacterium sp. 10S3]MEB0287199.1 DUF3846 domain-containing protein [Cryobacterium sp. 10S3]WPX14154.1 DUF3846 domain-containing protein [Cryobacterium sp. 10S3]